MIEQSNIVDYDNPYKFNGKELDTETGLYYYGARYYDPKLSGWLSVDPLAEKYHSINPYAYVANNPIRYIDPDGNEIVDANGKKITYDAKKGWSPNVTNDVKVIHSALLLTETGRNQWDKAYSSESKIAMKIVQEKLYSNKQEGELSLGQANQALGFDVESATYVKTDNVMDVTISIGSLNESFDGKNKGLSLRQAIGATAGHELEHTTEKNRDIGIQNLRFPDLKLDSRGRERIEIEPERIGKKIREESRNSYPKLIPLPPKQID